MVNDKPRCLIVYAEEYIDDEPWNTTYIDHETFIRLSITKLVVIQGGLRLAKLSACNSCASGKPRLGRTVPRNKCSKGPCAAPQDNRVLS